MANILFVLADCRRCVLLLSAVTEGACVMEKAATCNTLQVPIASGDFPDDVNARNGGSLVIMFLYQLL